MVKDNELLDPCIFCSVKMFGTDAYTGDNGETVFVDYIRDVDEYCKEHCKNHNDKTKIC